MGKTTRTLNPLHFEDLEPHRFEDLVRQLVYDFRSWRSIEATGRLGNDEGMDIRAIEGGQPGEADRDGDPPEHTTGRLWVFQCKREKAIGPRKVRAIVAEGIDRLREPLHGFVLAAACDFSKDARDAFREEAVARGVQEWHIWGKADLEDMLFQPRNDHLLFAYFNISLQVRRRSLRTELRSRLATKQQLVTALGPIGEESYTTVLLRDPRAVEYPDEGKVPDFAKCPMWLPLRFMFHDPPDHLAFVAESYFAYIDDAGEKWDAAFGYNAAWDDSLRVWSWRTGQTERRDLRARYWSYCHEHIPEKNQAMLQCVRFIHYDRVLAIDRDGDGRYQGPHLLVEFEGEDGPFERGMIWEYVERTDNLLATKLQPDDANRVRIFPEVIPPPDKEGPQSQ